MAMRKGMSTIIMVFIIIIVSLGAISWYQANVQTGSGQQEQLNTQSAFYDLGFNLDNAKLYLSEAFYTSAMVGSDIAGNYSGRYPEEDKYRYWLCEGDKQPPDADLAAYTNSNATNETFKDRIQEIRGVHGQNYYAITDPSCVGTETPTDPDDVSPSFNTHNSAFSIEEVRVGVTESNLERSDSDIESREPIKYNRYWFMYDRLENFIQQEDPSSYVQTQLGKIDDTNTDTNPNQCIPNDEDPMDECNFPDSYVCEGIGEDATGKVTAALTEMAKTLENDQDYFNSTGVSCSFENNEAPSGVEYPGVTVSTTPNNHYTENGGCGDTSCEISCDYDDTTACENAAGCTMSGGDCTRDTSVDVGSESECENDYNGDWEYDSTEYDCHTTWGHSFTAYVDTTLTCRDQNFAMKPEKKGQGHISWSIDLSFTASNSGSGDDRSSCPESGGDIPPTGLKNTCDFSEPSVPACDPGVSLDG